MIVRNHGFDQQKRQCRENVSKSAVTLSFECDFYVFNRLELSVVVFQQVPSSSGIMYVLEMENFVIGVAVVRRKIDIQANIIVRENILRFGPAQFPMSNVEEAEKMKDEF